MVLAGYGRPEPHTKSSLSQGEAGEDSQRFLFFPLVGSLSGGKLAPRSKLGYRVWHKNYFAEKLAGCGLPDPHGSVSEHMFHSSLWISVGTSHHFHNWSDYSNGSR